MCCIKHFSKRQILGSSKLKEFANDIFKCDEKCRKFNGKKTLWEKEKLLVTSNFFFSHSVLKSYTADMENPGLA